MAASDHLNPQQFMSVSDVGNLKSGDFPGKTMAEYAADPYRAARENKLSETYSPMQMADLTTDVEMHGMKSALKVKGDTLMNGHHRFRAAKELGMTHVPIEVM